jgi:hypothetical protein
MRGFLFKNGLQALLFSTLVGDATGREFSIPPIDQEQAIKVKIVSEIQYKKVFERAPLGVGRLGTVGRNTCGVAAATRYASIYMYIFELGKGS